MNAVWESDSLWLSLKTRSLLTTRHSLDGRSPLLYFSFSKCISWRNYCIWINKRKVFIGDLRLVQELLRARPLWPSAWGWFALLLTVPGLLSSHKRKEKEKHEENCLSNRVFLSFLLLWAPLKGEDNKLESFSFNRWQHLITLWAFVSFVWAHSYMLSSILKGRFRCLLNKKEKENG